LKWLNGDGSEVFWLYGHPGRSKTVLARFLIENLKTVSDNYPQLSPARSSRVIHYLFLEQDKERNSLTVVLRSLLHQLLLEDPSICHVIQHYFDLERTQYPERDSIALWNAFRGVLDLDRLKEVTIVLDGLDELDFSNLTSILGGLATTIKSINDRLPDHKLKLILSSRPNMTIMETLERKEVTPLKMEIDTRNGVESFITSEVNNFGSAHTFPEDLSRNIINEIL
jgi:Cdc6-like AAA superfamily ATPase